MNVCIAALNVKDIETKSALYSFIILLSYGILVMRLNKFIGIGSFVNVFVNIIHKSIKRQSIFDLKVLNRLKSIWLISQRFYA